MEWHLFRVNAQLSQCDRTDRLLWMASVLICVRPLKISWYFWLIMDTYGTEAIHISKETDSLHIIFGNACYRANAGQYLTQIMYIMCRVIDLHECSAWTFIQVNNLTHILCIIYIIIIRLYTVMPCIKMVEFAP